MPQDGQQEPLDKLIAALKTHGPAQWIVIELAEHLQQLRNRHSTHVLRVEGLIENSPIPDRIEAHSRRLEALDQLEGLHRARIETLERAIPYGPGENLGALLSRHRERIDKLEQDGKGRDGVIAAFRQALEGMGMTLAEQNQRANALHESVEKLRGSTGTHLHEHLQRLAAVEAIAYDTAQRHTAGMMRIDALESGRTGKSPIEFLKPSHAVQRHAQAPAFVHPDNLSTIVEVAADGGDLIALGIMALTKQRDELDAKNRANWEARKQSEAREAEMAIRLQAAVRERENATGALALAEKEWNDLRVQINPMIAPPFDGQTLGDAIAHTIQQLTLEVRSAREGGARAHDDSEQVRTALQRASKERDNALRAADKAKAQRDGVRSTVVDQAKLIEELRAEQRSACDAIADLQRDHAEHVSALTDRTNHEIAALVARVPDERAVQEWHRKYKALHDENDNAWMCLARAVDGQPFYSEHDRPLVEMISAVLLHYRDKIRELSSECDRLGYVARAADADRVPLRMDLDEAKAIAAITAPLVKVTQLWCNAWLHDGHREPIDRPMSSAMVANTCELVGAHETYEKAMAEHLANIPF